MKSAVLKLTTVAAFALAVFAFVAGTQSARAGDADPLFVSLISDDAHAATMALHLAKTALDEGHPVTVFFNNRGVLVASKGHTDTYPSQQKEIAALSSGGAVLLACPHCMKYYGIDESGLVSGVSVGKPETVMKQLFADDTKTLTW